MGEVETPGVQKQEWLYTEPLGSRSGCGEGEARQMAFSIITCLLCVFFLNTLFNFYLFIYFWLCYVFVSVRGLSLVAASGGHSSRCAGLSLSRLLLLRSTGSRRTGSVMPSLCFKQYACSNLKTEKKIKVHDDR